MIDVRNDYETRIGKFKGAVDPCTTAFREFPSWVEDELQHVETDKVNHSGEKANVETEALKEKTPLRIAMYCTGGIRCEKASSFLLSKGFKEVIFFLKNLLSFTYYCVRLTYCFTTGLILQSNLMVA